MKHKAQEASEAEAAPRVWSLQSRARGPGTTVFGGQRLRQARTVNEHVSVFDMDSYGSQDVKLTLERSPPRRGARGAAVPATPASQLPARRPAPAPITRRPRGERS